VVFGKDKTFVGLVSAFVGLVLVFPGRLVSVFLGSFFIPGKEEVDRYWTFGFGFSGKLDKFLGRFLDIGQIDAISINF